MIKNLKKVISTVAAVATLASSASALAVSFPDLEAAASYTGAVDALAALGIVNGDENGKFNPENNVTRAEFAKMVVVALTGNDTAGASTSTKFTDAQGHWAAGYIDAGVARGFINGYDDTTFGPDDTVTYAQAVKMLVGACGYSLWAENQGGWPSGYLAYGSSLDIVNGIAGTVSNETALTRSQCAVLIYNALKAPVLAVNGYEPDNAGNLVPQYEAQDGKNGREWQSMLTQNHDAYVVKGRVTATNKTEPSLEAYEVKFDVELSDNYKDTPVLKGETVENEIMGVGTTDAANLLFTYAEAIVKKDKDTEDLTLISLTPYGANKTVVIDANLIRVADNADLKDNEGKELKEANGTNPFDSKKPQIAVAKSESSSATTKYDLDEDVELYVNGIPVGFSEDTFMTYLKNNTTAKVTFIDATEEGSTSTNGKYDYIMVDYYVSAVVDSVSVSDTSVKVIFKNSTVSSINRLAYDPEDEDVTVTYLKKEGEDFVDFKLDDLKEFDVISIAYNVEDWASSNYYEVFVSNEAPIPGMLKSYDEDENTINIDGTDYNVDSSIDVAGYKDNLSDEFTLYIDAFGNVVYMEEGSSAKNYGIIVGAYESNSYDNAVVRMVTGDGEIKIIECKDDDVVADVVEIIEAAGKTVSGSTYLQKSDLTKDMIANLVVDYKLSSGKINKIASAPAANSVVKQEYKSSSEKLGSYALNAAATKFVVVEDYVNGGSDVGTIELSALEDEVIYDVYLYGKNKNTSVYQFVVVLGGLASVRDDSDLAIVKANAQLTNVNDEECWTMTVVKGNEEVELSVATAAVAGTPAEGDVIAYSVGTKGYVESGYYYVVAEGLAVQDYDSLYDMWLDGTVENSDYAKEIIVKNAKDEEGNPIPFDADDADVIFAPVYKKTNNTIEVFTKPGATSNVNEDTKDYTIGSETNIYVYDYSKSIKWRVEGGFVPNQSSNIFKLASSGAENEIITWADVATEDISVNYALIKTVDGDVTDIVIYVAE